MEPIDSQVFPAGEKAVGQYEKRPAIREVRRLDTAKVGHRVRAIKERLEQGFLGCEPLAEVPVPVRYEQRCRQFTFGEGAHEKRLPQFRDQSVHLVNIDHVNAYS